MRPLVTDPSEQLSGRELRRLTARAAAARAGSGAGEALTTVAYAVVCTAVAVGLVVGARQELPGNASSMRECTGSGQRVVTTLLRV